MLVADNGMDHASVEINAKLAVAATKTSNIPQRFFQSKIKQKRVNCKAFTLTNNPNSSQTIFFLSQTRLRP